ncbi:hypothetical protein RRG08_010075 [Elysia crispata]|uniref:Uncharacterized protein n=1 Tax=Elysia crispata TaxID=231223 RepID=A0AAE1ECC6_9GAST|nr:hypothetical protein RRG08_010075 [Elysia crispata]
MSFPHGGKQAADGSQVTEKVRVQEKPRGRQMGNKVSYVTNTEPAPVAHGGLRGKGRPPDAGGRELSAMRIENCCQICHFLSKYACRRSAWAGRVLQDFCHSCLFGVLKRSD